MDFWFSLDKHLSKKEFNQKVKNEQGYVLSINNQRIGILRYNLFGTMFLFVHYFISNKNIKEKVMVKYS